MAEYVLPKEERRELNKALASFRTMERRARKLLGKEFTSSVLPHKIAEILKPPKYVSNGEERIGVAKFKPGSREELQTLIDYYKSYNIESFRKSASEAEEFNVNRGDAMIYQTIREKYQVKIGTDIAENEQYKAMEVMQAKAGLIRKSDIEIQPAHLKEKTLQSRQAINALESRDKARFKELLATQYSYGTLGRRSQLDERYIDNYIESAKKNNLYQKGTRERLRAMTHDQLQAFANDDDRIKFKYGSDTEIGLLSTDEIDEYMDTLGLSWNTEFKVWE
jgi:hypothetical protein